MYWLILWEWNDDPSSIHSIATLDKPKSSMLIGGNLGGIWNHMNIQITFYFPESPSASNLKKLFLQSQINGDENVAIFKTPLILDPAYIPGFPQSSDHVGSNLQALKPRNATVVVKSLGPICTFTWKKNGAKNRNRGRTHKQPTGGCRLTWHLKISPWKRRFRTLKPSFLRSAC